MRAGPRSRGVRGPQCSPRPRTPSTTSSTLPDPATGFSEYQHGIEYLAQLYPRWISVFNLADYYEDEDAVSRRDRQDRSHADDDSGDGYDIWVVKLTDHEVPDEGKETLFYSLSVHGDERGGLEGGLRAIEDLASARARTAARSPTASKATSPRPGEQPEFHSYEVKDVLAKEAVYFMDFNVDGWVQRRPLRARRPGLYTRGNWAWAPT